MNTPVQYSLQSQFVFRRALKKNALYAVLDSTQITSLNSMLQETDLDFRSLFRGRDEVMLKQEAPFLVHLDPRKIKSWKPIFHKANGQNSGFLFSSLSSIDRLRSHWRKWLYVKIPTHEKLVLFRFYDPRVLFCFLATLSAADAAAFYGPTSDIVGYNAGQLVFASATNITKQITPTAFTAEKQAYELNQQQYSALSQVTANEFKSRLFNYFKTVWPIHSKYLEDDELSREIERSIEMAKDFGSSTEKDILKISLVRILCPKIAATDWILREVMNHETNDQSLRSGALEAYMTIDMSNRTKDIYLIKKFRFDDHNFGKVDPVETELSVPLRCG